MRLPSIQKGVTTTGFLALALLAFFVIYTAFKLVPAYAENRYIISALKSIAKNNDDLTQMTTKEIRTQLQKFYTVNNVRSEGSRNIEIDEHADKVIIDINYEERIDFLLNIDLLLTFNNQLDSSQPGRCCKPLEQ